MSSAAALLQIVSAPSATAQGSAAPSQDADAAALFTGLVAQLLAPETASNSPAPTDVTETAVPSDAPPANAEATPAPRTASVPQLLAFAFPASAEMAPVDAPIKASGDTSASLQAAVTPQLPSPEATPDSEAPAQPVDDEATHAAAPADAQLAALVQTLVPAAAAPKSEPVKTTPQSDRAVAKPVSSDMAMPVLPSEAKPVDPADEDPAAKPADIDAVKTELAALKLDTSEAVKPVPVEAPRQTLSPQTVSPQAFSLQAAAAETTATPYSPPPAIAAQASALSHTAVEQLSQLSVAIQKRLNDGTTKFQLELKPADLGRVDVALTITAEGKVSAHLEFDTPITATTFAARESELRQHLTAAGLKLDGDALTFSSRPTDTAATQTSAFTAFSDSQTGQQPRPNARQAARALKQADQTATEADLDAALAQLRHRPGTGRLALDLTV